MAGQDTVTARRKKPSDFHRAAHGGWQRGWTVYDSGGYHGFRQ